MLTKLLITGVLATSTDSFLKAYSADFDENSVRPIQRVVKLLNDMQAQLEKEATSDKDLYEELTCWCKENDKQKSQAVKEAEAKIAELEAEIEGRAGKQGELLTNIKQLEKEIAHNQASLAKATKMREEEQKDFREQHKDLVQAISSLKQAIVVLGKHNTNLLELSPEIKVSLKTVLRNAGQLHKALQVEKGADDIVPTPAKSTAFLSVETGMMAEYLNILQNPHPAPLMDTNTAARILNTAFAQESIKQPAGYKSYNNRSGQIFGILQSMLEEFEQKSSDDQKDEARAQAEFESLEKAKKREIESAEKQREQKKAEAGSNGKRLADAKEDLTATRETFSADKTFLRNLELQCQDIDHQFSQRSTNRSDEIAAISEALHMLTEDENREQLAKTTFLQVSTAHQDASLRQRVLQLLNSVDPNDDMENIWRGRNSPRKQLSTLAMKASLDSFKKVKEAMDKMLAELKQQQDEENKHKDYCNAEFKQNQVQDREANFKQEDLQTTIENLANQIDAANAEIAKAQKEVASLEVEIKRAGEDREKENKEFQQTINDQRATQQILQKVLARLNVFYKKNKPAPAPASDGEISLVAQQPPKSFGAYKENKGSNPVFQLIEKIVADSKASEVEAIADEKSSQGDYEKFVGDSNASIANLQRLVVTKSDAISSDKEDQEQAKADHDFTLSEIERLSAYRASLHQECDFLLKNFELRQDARQQEREAIAQAKAILSGAM